MFKIKRYKPEYKAKWDEFVKKANNATFLFERDFMDYHKDRFVDHSVLVYKGKTLIALLPANEVENVIHSHQGLSYGGLITNLNTKFADIYQCFRQFLKYYYKLEFEKVIYKSQPYYYLSTLAFEYEHALFLAEAKLSDKEMSAVIDLEDLIKWQKRRIRSLKKAVQSEINYSINSSLWKEFWSVLESNLKERHHLKPVHQLDEILSLKKLFKDNIVLWISQKKNEVVSGVVLFINNKTIHVQYSASTSTGKRFGALDGLLHEISNHYKSYKYLSLGVSNNRISKRINKGLTDWKEGFGSKAFPHNFHEIKTINYSKIII